jgi:basic amino acid/polyamine antiporter, APA family
MFKILQTAEQKGYATGWTIGGTFAALPFAIEAVLGFAWATYAGGEMRNIRRSSLMASVIPAMFVSVLFIVFGYAVYNTFGYDFSSAIGYLYNNFPSAVAAGTGAASAPLALPFVYSVFMNSNPYLVTFIAFSFPIGQAASILTSFLLVTRCLFAYSFDRVVPAKFSEVSERFHTPIYSIALLTVIAIIFVALSNLTSFFGTYLLNTTDGYIFSAIIVSIAAINFPYGKAKSVFQNAPGIVKARIGKVPVLVIVGGVSLVAFVYALYAGLTTPAIGGPISPYSFIFGLLIPFAFPVVVYYASRSYHRSRGVDIDLAFKEIPPE